MKKIIICFLVVILSFGAVLGTACGGKDAGEQPFVPPVDEETVIPEKDGYLVEKGVSQYKIVVPQSSLTKEQLAAKEIQTFIRQSTGAELPIVTDNTVTADKSSKLILLGNTKFTENYDLDLSKDTLGGQGYKIVTVDNNIVISGEKNSSTGYGTLNGAYDFLNKVVGFETYAADCIALDYEDSVKLLDFNITDKPAFEWRIVNYGSMLYDTTFYQRMRMETFTNMLITDYGDWHNFFRYIPIDSYPEREDYWFSPDKRQLCLTCRGVDEQRQDLLDEVFDKMIKAILANPGKNDITFSQQDDNVWCNCPECSKAREKYGTDAAVMIWFINDLADMVTEYFKKNNIDREVTLYFFSYHKTVVPPQVIDDSVKCRDNVAVLYAPLDSNRRVSYLDARNSGVKNAIETWNKLCGKIAFWSYSAMFTNFLEPYDTISHMQENYQWIHSIGAYYLFDQAQLGQPTATTWSNLKAYLNAKLAWDPYQDVNKLMNNFFENYFGPAAQSMRRLLDDTNLYFKYLMDENKVTQSEQSCLIKSNFTFRTLQQWMEMLDDAYSAIEPLELTDNETFKKISKRIMLESITYRYVLITLYGDLYFSEEASTEFKRAIKADCAELGMIYYAEKNPLTVLWSAWGV